MRRSRLQELRKGGRRSGRRPRGQALEGTRRGDCTSAVRSQRRVARKSSGTCLGLHDERRRECCTHARLDASRDSIDNVVLEVGDEGSRRVFPPGRDLGGGFFPPVRSLLQQRRLRCGPPIRQLCEGRNVSSTPPSHKGSVNLPFAAPELMISISMLVL